MDSFAGLADHRYVAFSLRYGSTCPDSVESMLAQVDETERHTYEGIVSPARRLQFLLGRFLVRRTLGRLLRKPPRAVPITAAGDGRPRVAPEIRRHGLAELLDFNISHCAGHVLMAMTVNGRVGVDVEVVERFSNAVARFVSVEEWRSVEQLPREARADNFCLLWTVKEACLKAMGMGLDFPLREIPVSVGTSGVSLGMMWDAIALSPTAKAAITLLPRSGETPARPGKVSEVSIKGLLEDGDSS